MAKLDTLFIEFNQHKQIDLEKLQTPKIMFLMKRLKFWRQDLQNHLEYLLKIQNLESYTQEFSNFGVDPKKLPFVVRTQVILMNTEL